MPFSPSTYLSSQGWEGPGNGLKKGGIKKPVTVAHKTNLKGIGKERDTGYAWWDDVFAVVANKKGGKNGVKDLKKTSTGIYSHLPASISGSATPVDLEQERAAVFHTDIIVQAKLEATRREFYSKFLRGKSLAGSYEESDSEHIPSTAVVGTSDAEVPSGSDKEKKRIRKAEKEERKRLRKEAKKGKQRADEQGKHESQEPITPEQPLVETEGSPEELQSKKEKKDKKRKRASADEQQDKNTPLDAAADPPEASDEDEKHRLKKLRKEERRRKRAEAEAAN